jgi:hypothetical protein
MELLFRALSLSDMGGCAHHAHVRSPFLTIEARARNQRTVPSRCHRYHLHSNVAGLALLGRRHGPVLAEDRRVVRNPRSQREFVLDGCERRRPRSTVIHQIREPVTAATRGGDSAIHHLEPSMSRKGNC